MDQQQGSRSLGPQQARVYLALRTAIEHGQFQPGQVIGSQAQLAAQHGVALATINHALRALEADGFVVRRQGVGTFVAENPPAPTSPLRALARFSTQSHPSSAHALDEALALVAAQVNLRSAFLSQVDGTTLKIIADYDDDGCGIRAGAQFPLADAF